MVLTPPQSKQAAPPKILIVEDEGIIAQHISTRLEKTGYEIAGIAGSAEEALLRVAELNPALILMDIRIKGELDGIATAEKIRELFDIPVIFLTAHTDQQTIDRAKRTGAYGFLTKPVHQTSLATSIEMTLHKHRAESEVRRQRAWLETILGAMADGVAVIDNAGRVQFLNRPAEELTGWSDSEARDQPVTAILPLVESATGLRVPDALTPPEPPEPARALPRGLRASRRSGRSFAIEGEVVASVDDGSVMGSIVTFRDATARQIQEYEARHEHMMQAVGRLAAGIAHDFNNLLFVILGYTEEILRTSPGLNDADREGLEEIRKAGESATHITGQLLKFSRKDLAEPRDLDLNEAIADTAELCKRLAGPSVSWRTQLDPSLGTIRADPGQVKQILMNLVANARDAMPDGGALTIGTAKVAAPRPGAPAGSTESFVSLTVTDTGTGMSRETAEHLFEPFFTTKALGKGTGLGLSIVHSIVTDLGGSIHVESEPGHGATFTLYLPRTAGAAWPAGDGGLHPAMRGADPPTVLLVEDNEAVRRLLANYLTDAGCHVLEAGNGEEAIRAAAAYDGPIPLLVTDIAMPGAGGFEVARAITAQRPSIDVIFVSGYAEEIVRGEQLPANTRFLPKPFVQRELVGLVGDLMRKKAAAGTSA